MAMFVAERKSVAQAGGQAARRSVAITTNRLAILWDSAIGKKVVMAVTGIVLAGFVIAHMLGNLKIFAGPAEINAYSRFLRTVGQPELGYGDALWLVRIVAFVAHRPRIPVHASHRRSYCALHAGRGRIRAWTVQRLARV